MVEVTNVTRNTALMTAGRLAATEWTRLRGLIGVKELAPGTGLLIRPCRGVHCMFMSIPIDVVYVDKSDKVVALDRAMKPWAIGKIYGNCLYVIELPPGTIDQSATQVGDQLAVQ